MQGGMERAGWGRAGGTWGSVSDPHHPRGQVREEGGSWRPWNAGVPARCEPGGQWVAWLFLHQLEVGGRATVFLGKDSPRIQIVSQFLELKEVSILGGESTGAQVKSLWAGWRQTGNTCMGQLSPSRSRWTLLLPGSQIPCQKVPLFPWVRADAGHQGWCRDCKIWDVSSQERAR